MRLCFTIFLWSFHLSSGSVTSGLRNIPWIFSKHLFSALILAPCSQIFFSGGNIKSLSLGIKSELDFFRSVADRLKKGGYLINVEISFDLDSVEYPSMLKNWESIQRLMGATAESLAKLPSALKEILSVMPPAEIGRLIRLGGINNPVQFFQAFMINGWYGIKWSNFGGPWTLLSWPSNSLNEIFGSIFFRKTTTTRWISYYLGFLQANAISFSIAYGSSVSIKDR